ncbi:MAG: XdhC family protein [Phycisphaerae bacterium]
MKDVVTLLAAAAKLHTAREEGVLVTLVHTQGSTYRRPGARMLVFPGCRTVGTISGGCLESAVAKEAWKLTRNDPCACFSFESSPEDDTWGPASGCHGILHLLAERIAAGEPSSALQMLARVRETHRPSVLPHYFRKGADGELAPIDRPADPRWESEEAVTLANATTRWVEHEDIAAFLEYLQPPMHLLICGAGDDAQPLARIAAELAWSVDLLDTRARLATAGRFPTASQVFANAPARAAGLIHPHSAVVLMSHRFADDVEFLAALLTADPPPPYIGLLGPRRRADRMLAELADRGIRPTPKHSAAIRTPVGLDLGSNSPETIALAIIAEIQASAAQRDARPLSQRAGPIHGTTEGVQGARSAAKRSGECAL